MKAEHVAFLCASLMAGACSNADPAQAQAKAAYKCKAGDVIVVNEKYRPESDPSGAGEVTGLTPDGDCKVRMASGYERNYISWQLHAADGPQPSLPASLPTGIYTCFASVPRYTGSSYDPKVGSVPQYSFTWQRQGNMTFGKGTWSGGPGGSGRFTYAGGRVNWSGGSLDGKSSAASINGSGKLEVAVPVTGQGKVDRWQCSPASSR